MEKLNNLINLVSEELNKIETKQDVLNLKATYLSKKGIIQEYMIKLKDLPKEDIPSYGKKINEVKVEIEKLILLKEEEINNKEIYEKLKKNKIDVTLDSFSNDKGSLHPLTQIMRDVEETFLNMGYEIKEGPELEIDDYNFERLNIPKDHPARDMQDSLFVDATRLLRTHTSPVQVRTMLEKKGQPLRMICLGKTYRRDDDDQTHSHQFMQMEGLVLGEDINFAHLKATLLEFAKRLFGEDKEIRLRPSYFPFTEPSCEVDVLFDKKNKKYIEILGSGMVNKKVLEMCGYDPEKIRGFAFGVGIERIAMVKYNIKDIRNFYVNDLRFLNQFKGGK